MHVSKLCNKERKKSERESKSKRETEEKRNEKETNNPEKAKKSSDTEPGRETRVRWWRARGGASVERAVLISY